MKWSIIVLTIVAAVAGVPRGAWAWGDEGHKVVCEIAMRLVHPTTRAEIQKLISTDERFNSFSDSCTWPDHPRQRAAEHFLNLPRDSDGLHSETCPGASACVVTAIKKDFEVLSSNSARQCCAVTVATSSSGMTPATRCAAGWSSMKADQDTFGILD